MEKLSIIELSNIESHQLKEWSHIHAENAEILCLKYIPPKCNFIH